MLDARKVSWRGYNRRELRAAVVVLGPLDHSPRMSNHALAISNLTENYRVDIIGYGHPSCLSREVQENDWI